MRALVATTRHSATLSSICRLETRCKSHTANKTGHPVTISSFLNPTAMSRMASHAVTKADETNVCWRIPYALLAKATLSDFGTALKLRCCSTHPHWFESFYVRMLQLCLDKVKYSDPAKRVDDCTCVYVCARDTWRSSAASDSFRK